MTYREPRSSKPYRNDPNRAEQNGSLYHFVAGRSRAEKTLAVLQGRDDLQSVPTGAAENAAS